MKLKITQKNENEIKNVFNNKKSSLQKIDFPHRSWNIRRVFFWRGNTKGFNFFEKKLGITQKLQKCYLNKLVETLHKQKSVPPAAQGFVSKIRGQLETLS